MARTRTRSTGPLIGAHVSVAGGFPLIFGRARDIGAECMQVFTVSPRQWRPRPLLPPEVDEFEAEREGFGPTMVMAHASYLINLGSTDRKIADRGVRLLRHDLERGTALGLDGLILHPGSPTGRSRNEGLRRIARRINKVLESNVSAKPRLLLENTVGGGNQTGESLEELRELLALTGCHPRVGFCLDTAHALAAGYPLHETGEMIRFVAEADRVLGRDRVAAWHLNDSQAAHASHRDRHANLGTGHLGWPPFRELLGALKGRHIALMLETPGGPQRYREEIRRLKEIRRRVR